MTTSLAKSRANWLGFAILLVFFRDRGRFPRAESEIDRNRVEELAWQLNLSLLLRFQQITQKFVVEKTVQIDAFAVGAEGFQACAAKFPELGQKVRVERSCL
jgi:hypothetical protein